MFVSQTVGYWKISSPNHWEYNRLDEFRWCVTVQDNHGGNLQAIFLSENSSPAASASSHLASATRRGTWATTPHPSATTVSRAASSTKQSFSSRHLFLLFEGHAELFPKGGETLFSRSTRIPSVPPGGSEVRRVRRWTTFGGCEITGFPLRSYSPGSPFSFSS